MAETHLTLNADYEINEDFSNCTSTSNGGAIYVAVGKKLTSDGNEHTFSGNSAANGGAIAARNSTFTISDIAFNDNTATTYGGAIYAFTNAQGTVTNCSFNGNTASKGGAIYVGTGTVTVNGCKFLTASDSIFIVSSNAKLILEGDINLAASINGGAVDAYATMNGAKIYFNNSESINVAKLVKGSAATADMANTLVFNYDSGMVNFLASQDSGRLRQDLRGINLVYNRENDDDNLKVQVATGAEKVDNAMEFSDDYKKVGFFNVDKSKNLMYVWTDTLYVVNTSNKNYVYDVDAFDTLENLYKKAGDEFAGNIVTTVEAGTTIGTTKKTKSVRGAYNKVNSTTVTIDGTVTGSVMGFYAKDGAQLMSDHVDNEDKLDENVFKTTVVVSETGRVDKYVIGGAYTKTGQVAIMATELVLKGTINGHTFGGSFVYGEGAAVVGETCVGIAGATIADGKYVLGGGMASGEGESWVQTAIVDVASDCGAQIFGGGWGQQGSTAEVQEAEIYLTDVTVDTVFAGGTNDAAGNSDVTIGSTIFLDGATVNQIYLNGKNSGSALSGTATLEIQGDSQVEWIDGLTASGFGGDTETIMNVGANLTVGKIAHVDTWNISKDCSIDYTGTLNFRQTYVNGNDPTHAQQFGNKIALNITGGFSDEWDVITSANKIVNFNDTYLEVTLFGQEAAYDQNNGAFISNDYALGLSDDKKSLQLAMLR